MTNVEIRRKILRLLYESSTEHPYNRTTPKEFKQILDIGLKELHFNIIYLEEKGYVELSKPLEGSLFVGARITPRGVDLVEDECEFNVRFPLQPAARHGSTDIIQWFDALSKQVSELPDVSDDSKELIIEGVKSIQAELNKSKPIYSAIKTNADRIKERNFETWQKLIEIFGDPVIAAILSHAARNELGT